MPTFEYQVKDRTGKDKSGVQEAQDVAGLVSELRSQGFIVVRVNEIKKSKPRIAVKKNAQIVSGNLVIDIPFVRRLITVAT